MEATVCCRFYYWSEIKSFEQRSSCKAPTLMWLLLKWNGHDCDGSMHYAIWVLLLSCDYVLKFELYCQLSGSGSNSLNLRKLPGRYFYGLGTRLDKLRWTLVTEDCNLPLFLWRGCSSSSELCPNTMPNTGEYHSLWVAMVMAADVLYMWCVCVCSVCAMRVWVCYTCGVCMHMCVRGEEEIAG